MNRRYLGTWAVAGFACLVASVATAEELPLRKAGLWKVNMSSGDGESISSEECVDAASDRAMQKMGQGMAGTTCSKNEVKRTASGYVVASECTFGESKMISTATFTGDFQSSYEGKIESSFTPPFMGQGKSSSTLRGTYAGPCAAGQKPGDIVVNGQKLNVHDLGGAAPK